MLACSFVRDWEESQISKEISFRSETRMVAFKSAMQSVFDSGYHVGAAIRNELLYEIEHDFSSDEFESFAESYLTPREKTGMKNIAWIPAPASPDEQAESHFRVAYSLYGSVFGIESGVDAAANPTHLEHIQEAIESGETVLDMYRDRESPQIISLFVPLFADDTPEADHATRKFLGLVYSEWDIGELLRVSLSKLPVGGLDFYLHELKPSGEMVPIFLHSSRARSNEEIHYNEAVWKEDFWVAEHQWQLSSFPSPTFVSSHPVVLAWMSLVFGVLLSISIAIYIWRVSVRNELIELQVDLRTAEVKRSQKSLEETEKIAHLGGWEWDVTTGRLSWSDEVYRIFGFEPGQFTPSYDRFLQLVYVEDRDRLEGAVNEALKGNSYNIVHRITMPDGSIRAVQEQGRVEFDDHGKPVRMIGTIQDITEQRRVERRLHRLATALAETAESIIITNSEGAIRYVNRAFEKLSGYSADDVVGKRPNIVKSGEHSDEYYDLMWDKVTNGEVWFGTFINRNREGGLYEVEQTISPIHDMQGDISGYVAVQRDVTGERERRSKMEHTQRLESLGILAGGIAHDFNNLLTAIIGNANLARLKTDSNEIALYLDRIEATGEHAADLCKQMLAYSGQGEYLREWFDLNDRIHDMIEFLQVSVSKNVSLTIDLEQFPCQVYGDKSQLQQVVMNLAINASEAIEGTGDVRLSTHLVEMTEADFKSCIHHEHEAPKPGFYLCLTASDNGCGMSDETRLKLFDPFFTTKFTGRGLGTSAILGIVQSHHGALDVESKVNVGTTFKAYFPCSVDQTAIGDEVEQPSVQSVAGLAEKTILIIDDEEHVLEVVSMMVEKAGCKTLRASTATQGIALYEERGDEIDMTILDMTMPDMDGLSCAKRLLEINAGALLVLSSGYNKDVLEERAGDTKISGFLQKPYSYNALNELIQELI